MLTLEKIASECLKTNIPLQINPQEEVQFQQSANAGFVEIHSVKIQLEVMII